MKSRNFLRSYIQLLSIIMIMILGAIIVVFVDFGAKEKNAVAVKLSSFHAASEKEKPSDEPVDLWSFDRDVLVSVSKTALSNYVGRGQKDVTLLHLLIQNNKNEDVRIEKLFFKIEGAELAENYRVFEGENLLKEFTPSEKSMADIDFETVIPMSEQRQFYVQADISGEAKIARKIRFTLNTADDLVLKAGYGRLNLIDEDLYSPYIRVVGK